MSKRLTSLVVLICLPILLAGPASFGGFSAEKSSWGSSSTALQADDFLQLSNIGFSRSEELPRIVVSRIPQTALLIIFTLLVFLLVSRPELALRVATIGSSTSRRW